AAPLLIEKAAPLLERLKAQAIAAAASGKETIHRMSAIDVRAAVSAPVPRSWKPVEDVKAALKAAIDNTASINLRLASGRVIELSADEKMAEFVEKGYFQLFINPRADFDVDDDTGRKIWSSAY